MPEGDLHPYPFYRRPFIAPAQVWRMSPKLHVLLISRRSGVYVVVGFRVPRDGAGFYRSGHYVAPRANARTNPGGAARAATGIAVRIAGRRRQHLHMEWAAMLSGSPEEGITFSPGRQLVLALGFLLAASRMRVRDAARPAWRPVDWLLRAPSRTNAFITAVVGAQLIYIVGDHGLPALVAEVWEPCGAAGASLFVLARWLRRVRGIELAPPEAEQSDE
ncbi:hypothetical protein [Streptomyces capoamus]|uniref:hypothetical protein n=1 Tax=Streptomyces capoamus TaxID=68183 RepID=UPI0033998BA2